MFRHILNKLRAVFQPNFIAVSDKEQQIDLKFETFDYARYLREEFPQVFSLLQGPQNHYDVPHLGRSHAREIYRQLQRLGVTCLWENNSCLISRPGISFKIHGTTLGLNERQARAICKDKNETKRILSEHGFRVPRGRVYAHDNMPAESELPFPFPLVLKPVDGQQGIGVNTNIRSYEDIRAYWQTIPEGKSVLMEEFIAGIDLRCTVVDGKLLAAVSRTPAHVFGDGVSTIEELIRKKDEVRSGNPDVKEFKPVVVPPRDLNVVPRAGEMVILNPLMNMSTGGDSVNVTPFLSDEVRKTIEAAVACIEGAHSIGADIMASGFTEARQLVFIEFNTSAAFTFHKYPCYGEPIDVVETIGKYIKQRLLSEPLPEKTIKEILARNKANADVQMLAWEIYRTRSRDYIPAPEETPSMAEETHVPAHP